MRIALAIPTNRSVKPKTAQSLLNLVAFSKDINFDILVSSRGYNTSENRNWLAAKAVNSGCDYLFFVDDDMVFPPDTLEELLMCEKDIVGCIYKTKYEVQEDVAEYFNKPTEKGLFLVKAIGTGCLLIKTDVFRKLPQHYKDTKGWFNYIWNNNGSVATSHDWLFCKNVRDLGFDIWALNTIDVKHIGQKIY